MTRNIQYRFENKGVVVTGGAQGIGFQIAKDFLAAGARISIWDYSEEAIQAAVSELQQMGDARSRIHTARVDVSRMDSCLAAAAALPFKTDILVNNAGITRDKSFAKMTAEEFETVIQTNLNGVFYVTRALLDHFNPASDQRRVISLASVVALYGNFGQTNYAASKAGVIGMTRTLARELGRKGFTVNAIAPGFIQTRMTRKMPEDVIKGMVAKVPVGRMGEVSDISGVCLFLASEEASYVNGAVLNVDGGLVV